jgi:uncharacterized lipoprotein YmbA
VDRAGPLEAPKSIVLGVVLVAPYLDRAGLVVEVAPGQVRAARLDQWAEPLSQALHSFLRDELSLAIGFDISSRTNRSKTRDYTIDVNIDRLHASMQGQAVLDAGYLITDADGEAVEYRFSRSRALANAGYDGMVEAEAALLRELCADMAASLRQRMGS